jgi:hypothetical protein
MFAEKARVLNTTYVAWKACARTVLAVAVTAAVGFTSGCANLATTSMDNTPMPGAAIQGKVKGGQFPVSGGTIGLFVAGSTGYGSSGGANLLTTTVTTAADGSFSFPHTYTCPSPSSLLYLTASGGNPGLGANNSAIMLVAPLGACGSLTDSTFINVNEVTTAAAAIALGQFFTPTFGSSSTDSFGTSSTNSVGLANAFATVNSLVDISTGAAVTSATLTNNGFTITTAPESAKFNTIANILAACVNSDGSGTSPCQTTLFPDVTPAGGTAPTDTLQAAVYMSLNPASNNSAGSSANLTALYGLQTATAPFVGVATQPTDWTVGIQYTDSTASAPVLTGPQNIVVDASGNVWVANNTSGASGALGELSPTGTPMVGTNFAAATNGPITTINPRNIAVDLTGNIWLTTSSSSGVVFQYTPSSASVSSIKLGKGSYGLAIDGNNNVYVGEESSSDASEASSPLGPNSLYEFPNGNLNSLIEFPTDGSTNILRPEYLAFDTSGNLWATDGGDQATTVVQLSGIAPCTPSSGTPGFCTVTQSGAQNLYTTISQGSPDAPDGVAAGIGGIWYANRSSNSLTFLSLTGATVNGGTNYAPAGGFSAPKFVAVDGAGNVWTASNNVTSPTDGVSEISSTGVLLSPVPVSPATSPVGFAHSGLSDAAGVAVDPSGNVWVANNVASGIDATSVFEIVGSGAPTVTPIALSLKNNAVGQKP